MIEGWLKEWFDKQEQLKRLVDTYENHEMDAAICGKEQTKLISKPT